MFYKEFRIVNFTSLKCSTFNEIHRLCKVLVMQQVMQVLLYLLHRD